MKVNCCCCRRETNDDEAEMIYQGSGVAQYVCPKCQYLPFTVVMGRAEEDNSPAYIGDKLRDEVLGLQS